VRPEVDVPVADGAVPVDDAATGALEVAAAPGTLYVEVAKPDAEVVGGTIWMDWIEADDKGALDATLDATGELAAGALAVPDALVPADVPDDWDESAPPIPLTAAQVPEKPVPGVAPAFGVFVISGPGSGNWTSWPSIVVHPFARFATKRSGRDEKATVAALRVFEPAAMVIEAQFM